jgi:hypothetical protein
LLRAVKEILLQKAAMLFEVDAVLHPFPKDGSERVAVTQSFVRMP